MASFLDKISSNGTNRCQGLVFVITGAVNSFKNRNEFVAYVVSQGGRVADSVTAKTDYLVNNDINSNSTKNRKAKELGVPIITEDEFIEKFTSAKSVAKEDARLSFKVKMMSGIVQTITLSDKTGNSSDPLLDALERYYPEHKVFALDSIDGGLRTRLAKRAKEQGYDNTTDYLHSCGYEIISSEEARKLRSNVGYPPGKEPEIIKTKLESVFRRLDEKYPDRLLPVTLQSDSKSLAGDLSGLYQWLGYQNYWALLKAYGYQVDCIQSDVLQALVRKYNAAGINSEEVVLNALMELSFMDVRLDRFGQIYIARALTCDPEIRIPAGIDYISSSAFANQRDLRKVTIEAQLQSIPEKAFANCEQLVSVQLPNDDIRIDETAFQGTPQETKFLAIIHEKANKLVRIKDAENKKALEEQKIKREQRAAEAKTKIEASIRKQIESEMKAKDAELKRREEKLATKETRALSVLERRLAKLEQYYPEHKVFALDSIDSKLREGLSASAQQEGLSTYEELLNFYGFEVISSDDVRMIRNSVLYMPGNEPDFMKNKIDSMIRRLESYYPDHIIKGSIQNDHKSLSKDISGLYQWFGYADTAAMLKAYGFSYEVKEAGRPQNDYEGVINSLIEKYKDKAKPKNMGMLVFDNPELRGPIKTLQNNANELFGMSLKKYFEQLGLFADKTAKAEVKANSTTIVREEAKKTLQLLYSSPEGKKHGAFEDALAALDGMNVKQNKNGGVYIFRAVTCNEEVTIPYGVDSISAGAFKDCSSIRKVRIRAAIKEIPADAFHGCSFLTEIDIPEGVASIGENAFADCSSLERITLPKSLQAVSKGAFCNCTSLETVTMQNDYIYVDPSAFSGCPYEYVPQKDENATSEDVFIFSRDRKGYVTITGIDRQLFHSDSMVIPSFIEGSLVTGIGIDAFADCRDLVEISMPDTITFLQRGAFRDCIKLKKVHLSNGIDKLITTSFNGCSNLAEINIPDAVTEVKKGTFRDSPLKTLHIGKRLRTLDITPFFHGEKDDYTGRITATRAIRSITVDSENPYLKASGSMVLSKDGTILLAALGQDRVLHIPDGVTSISQRAFEGLEFLTDVYLPDSLVEIGANAFASTGLRRIAFGKEVKHIKSEAFYHCEHLTSAIFNDSIIEIGDRAFYKCPIPTVKLPATVQVLGDACFNSLADGYYGDSKQNLEIDSKNPFMTADGAALYVPSNTEKVLQYFYGEEYRRFDYFNSIGLKYVVEEGTDRIESGAFYHCYRLGEVVLPEGLSSIGDNAFRDCSALKMINLPDSISSIGKGAFFGSSIDHLHIGPNVKEIGAGAFIMMDDSYGYGYEYHSIADLTVDERNPVFFIENGILYQRIEGGFLVLAHIGGNSQIVLKTGTIEIADEAFRYSDIEEIHIPASVKKIGENAFSGCKDLLRLRFDVAGDNTAINTAVVYIPETDSENYHEYSAHDQYMDCIRIDGQGSVFDFVKYDSLFESISEQKSKILIAIDRLKSAVQLVPLYKEKYLTYLQNAPDNAVRIATEFDDLSGLNTLAELGVFTGKNIDDLIELANRVGNTGIVGFLMNYKNAEIGITIDNEFEL